MEIKGPGEAPSKNWLKKVNKNSESVTEKGQKLQLPVRFESNTLNLIENISKKNGFSKAETVRRLVSQGLEKLSSTQEADKHGGIQ